MLGQSPDGKAGGLPVSVKTRIGYNRNELETWLPELLAEEPAMITIHARTRKEMSDVSARWEEVKRAVEIRDALKSEMLIFGNGDVKDLEDAGAKARASGADGVMLGRAIFGRPWLFANLARAKRDYQIEHPTKPSAERDALVTEKKLKVMLEHTELFETLFNTTPAPKGHTSSRFARQWTPLFGARSRSRIGAGFNIREPQSNSEERRVVESRANIKNFSIMKKHYKAYVQGFDGAKELRMKLMGAESAEDVERLVGEVLKNPK